MKIAPTFWITHVFIVTQNKKREIIRGSIRIANGRIEKIKKSWTLSKSDIKNAAIIDGKEMHLFPGFIQTHLHLCQTLFRNAAEHLELLDWLKQKIWLFESKHTWQSLHASSLLGISELLRSGTTCILDMGTVRHTDAIFQAVKKTGIRANVGKCLMDHPRFNPPALRETTQAALQESLNLIQTWNHSENDRIRASFAPRFALSCTPELLKAVSVLSKELQVLVHTHACENQDEIALVRKTTGRGNIAYFKELGLLHPNFVCAHGVWLTPQEIQLFKKSRASLSHCPSSNLKLASGIADIPTLHRAGVNLSIGTDGAACSNHLGILEELRLAGLIQKPKHGPKAMPSPMLLDLATLGGAKALQWQEDIGSIEVGKKADFSLMDLRTMETMLPFGQEQDLEAVASTLIYSGSPSCVKSTWVDGHLVWNGKKVRGVHTESLRKTALAEQRRIFSK